MPPSRERAPNEGSDEGDDGRRPGRRGAATAASRAGGPAEKLAAPVRVAVLHAETGTAPSPFAAAEDGGRSIRGRSTARRCCDGARIGTGAEGRSGSRPDELEAHSTFGRTTGVGAANCGTAARGASLRPTERGRGWRGAPFQPARRGHRQARPVGRPMVEETKRSCRLDGRIRPARGREGGLPAAERPAGSTTGRPRRRDSAAAGRQRPAAFPAGPRGAVPLRARAEPHRPSPAPRGGAGDQPASGSGSRV